MKKFTIEGADIILDLKEGLIVYTLEQKQLAVETYLKLKSTRKTIRCLGFPSGRNTLLKWIGEYRTYGKVTAPKRKNNKPTYSDEQIDFAVNYWSEHGQNITLTCNHLGYPCRNVLSKWLDERFPDCQTALGMHRTACMGG